jgi:group II intron reverse transcriptase/maturase
MNIQDKVQILQRKLYRIAKQSPKRKFGALYDKVYRKDVLNKAWNLVRANKGKPGIDGESIDYIRDVIGSEKFLSEISEELHKKDYRPTAVKRCWITKPGKLEKRPLGIPTVKDRVVQTACRLIIEPIFESNFLDCSYGFRPKRNAHQAIDVIRRKIRFEHYDTVIDADIKGYFNNINHELLLNQVKRRINDPRVLHLLKGWLQSGVIEDGKLSKTENGSPQGSTISPLLANIYLHSFDRMFERSKIPGILIRFCDDFVILLKRNGEEVLTKVNEWLKLLKLELHPEKTRITTVKDGFDFLSYHFKVKPTKKVSWYCWTWPSNKAIQSLKYNIKKAIGRKYSLSLKEIIHIINPKLRGWRNYHKDALSKKRFKTLNYYVWDRLRIFVKRKYSDRSRGGRRLRENLFSRLGLYQLA